MFKTFAPYRFFILPFIFTILIYTVFYDQLSNVFAPLVWGVKEPSYMDCVVERMNGMPEVRRQFVTFECEEELYDSSLPWVILLAAFALGIGLTSLVPDKAKKPLKAKPVFTQIALATLFVYIYRFLEEIFVTRFSDGSTYPLFLYIFTPFYCAIVISAFIYLKRTRN